MAGTIRRPVVAISDEQPARMEESIRRPVSRAVGFTDYRSVWKNKT
jgi:hypothetical protein